MKSETAVKHSLEGKVGLVLGIANDRSIAYGCARAFRQAGAVMALTYLNDKARPHVEPLARELEAPVFLPCNVETPGELEAVFEAVKGRWGRLDFALHAVAFAPRDDLHGRLVDSTPAGFARAMDVSCHSFVRMARLAEPIMTEGGSLLTLSFLGSHRVVEGYQLMGPVKAALESIVAYLAAELGPAGIRVNALSPGPIATRAACGLRDFDQTLQHMASRSPARQSVGIHDVGHTATFLASDEARFLSGQTIFVDGGYHVLGT